MRFSSRLFLGLLASSFLLTGCVRRYQPPKPNEPHAIVKLRRVYESHAGVALQETATIGKEIVLSRESPAAEALIPEVDAILVHPEPADLALSSAFFHPESRMVRESYTESVPHQESESYNCGSYKERRTCSRSVTRYRQEIVGSTRRSGWSTLRVGAPFPSGRRKDARTSSSTHINRTGRVI